MYIDRKLKALVMPRSEWENLINTYNGPVEIELSETLFAALAENNKIVGSFAERIEEGIGLIRIFREDPKDAPKKINQDKYKVIENFRSREDYPRMVTASATSDDDAMHSFHEDYVIIIPEDKGGDHHLLEIPSIYLAVVENRREDN